MQPDEILRLDRDRCIALFQGHKPALLYKLDPEDLPAYGLLRTRRIIDYTPEWKRQEIAKAAAGAARPASRTATAAANAPAASASVENSESGGEGRLPLHGEYDYDFSGIDPNLQEGGWKAAGYSEVIGFDEEDVNDLCP
jgi:type IV secretion system protein VirD4